MARTLVTGGSGFIGRQVVDALETRKLDIAVIGRGTRPKHLPARASWHRLDLLDRQAVTDKAIAALGADRLIHLAWETTHGGVWHDVSNLDWIGASARLLHAFLNTGGRRLVGIGSATEYAAPAEGPCHEYQTPRSSAAIYMIAKDTFRRVAECCSKATGASLAWARVFPAYGEHEHEHRLVPSVVRALLRSDEARCTSGRQVHDYMDVRDHGEAIAALAMSDIEGIVNIGSGNPVSIADLVKRLAEQMGRAELVRIGALPDRPGEPLNLWPDITRLRDEVKFAPAHSLDDGLKDAIAWWSRQDCT